MGEMKVKIYFEPEKLAAGKRGNGEIVMSLSNESDSKTFWCECDVHVDSQLSLAMDRDLNEGRTRIGIIKPGGVAEKRVRFYAKHGSIAGKDKVRVTSYAYDEDGAIYERGDTENEIEFL